LTAEQHRQSLAQDALRRDPDAAPAALARLRFYYPRTGEELVLKFLSRPLYDNRALWDFISNRLVKMHDLGKWPAQIEEFGRHQGQAALDALPFRLHRIFWDPSVLHDKEFLEGKAQAVKILARLYPRLDFETPSFLNAVAADDQAELINELAAFHSDRIDQAVYQVFRSAADCGAATAEGRVAFDDLTSACMSRLVHKGHDEEFRAYVRMRLKAVEALPQKSDGRRSLDALHYWNARLGE
jgi:hypothetical protein